MKRYQAHWGTWLIVMSLSGTALFLVLAFAAFRQGGASSWAGALSLALIAACALFTIRGYTVTPNAILVHRLFWATRLPMGGLEAAWFDPRVAPWGIRFGNAGLFSLTGLYRNKFFGPYRAFATDGRLAVALQFFDRTIVVSPVAPEDFVDEVLSMSRVACRRAAVAPAGYERKRSNATDQGRQAHCLPDLRA